MADIYGPTGAAFYDAASSRLRGSSGDSAFYLSLAKKTGGPVLELGCGSGRVLLPIARTGIPCTGLDPSRTMLARLRKNDPPSSLRLVQERMQDFDLPGERFALIYSAFRAFQHLLTVEDELSCLAAVRRHLAPKGIFALDVFAPKLDRIAVFREPEFPELQWKEGETQVRRLTSVARNPATQVFEVRFRHEIRRPGKRPESRTVRTKMRWLFRYELEHLLARAGFTGIQVFGGFDRRSYDYFSGETVVIART
ncbi:MAG TPA: class I SAM-dependent methyltransferase [Thermoanaerobaculia bacterium]|nr:class I SAM-dependent methyltransferase [Thermoanaerobaculia bacterium]